MIKIKNLTGKMHTWFTGINLSIRKKLLFGILLITIVPLAAIGGITYKAASNAMMKKAKDNLESIGSTKATAINTFFDERRADMNVLREIVFTMQQEASSKLAAVRESKIIWLEDYMLNRIGDAAVLAANPTIVEALQRFENAGRVQSSNWRTVAATYKSWLTQFKETYVYYNIYGYYKRGRVLYSVDKQADLGQSLASGGLKNSAAGKAFRKGMRGVAVQDFEVYQPSGYSPVAFFCAPIKSGGRVQGVVMGQITVDSINTLLQDRTGLSDTSEAYLIAKTGSGYELRSERVIQKGRVGDSISGAFLDKAFSGKPGTEFGFDQNDIYTINAFAPIKLPGLQWAINVTAPVEEVISPKFEQAEEDFFTYYKEGYGYLNFYLLNPQGYLFYSVIHEKDYHTNLLTGPYKDTNLGQAVRASLSSKQLKISDFEKYAPNQDTPAAFISQPIVINDEVVLIVAAELSMAQIQVVLEDYTGLGRTGDTYLIGADGLWRSDFRFLDDLGIVSTMLNPDFKVTTRALQEALSGHSDTQVVQNFRGEEVLSAWSTITVQRPGSMNPEGVKWAIFSDINLSEVRKPVVRMAWIWAGVLVVTLIAVVMVSFAMAGGLTGQIHRIMNLFSDIGMGQYDSRVEVVSQDELGTMANSLNAMLDNTLALIQSREERDAMQEAVMKLLSEISALTDGDLTARAEVTEHITGAIADSFNAMAEQLALIVRGVKQATLQVNQTSNQVSGSTVTLARMSEQQAKQIYEAINVINNITASIQEVAENASKSASVSKRSMISAQKGAEAVGNTNIAMATIRERAQETARAIKRLGESSQEIGNIIQIINDIADRTSILALNASIQAAMAGDAGRGFAVVAEEVQRLAERSTASTKQIETLVQNIQRDIHEAGKSMDESIQRVVEGSKLANDAFATLQDIESVSSQVAKLIHSISSASKEQASASETISKTMMEVGEISSQTSTASQKTAAAMQDMAKTAERLRISVEAFKIDEEDNAAVNDAEPTNLLLNTEKNRPSTAVR